jgi:hypothetical protein
MLMKNHGHKQKAYTRIGIKMERTYLKKPKKNEIVKFFHGIEVEHTPAYGLMTLFVVGIRNVDDILKYADRNDCEHIYLGANQSFFPEGHVLGHPGLDDWDKLITKVLTNTKLFVTLDFDVKWVEHILDYGWTEHIHFIPMISVKLPYVTQLGYNASLKIDDIDFDKSNPGVWTHQVHDLLDRNRFTPWREYSSDTIIKEKKNDKRTT